MNFSGWNSVSSASPSRSSRASAAVAPDVAGQHPRPLDVVERPVERLRDRRLEQTFAQADPQLAGQHLDDVLRGQRVGSAPAARGRSRPCAPGPTPPRSPRRRPRPRARSAPRRAGAGPAAARARPRPRAQVGRAVVRLAEGAGRDAGEVGHGRCDRRPAEAGRALVGLRERPPGEEHAAGRKLVGRQGSQVVGQERGLLGGPTRGCDPLGELAPAAHGGDGIPCRP